MGYISNQTFFTFGPRESTTTIGMKIFLDIYYPLTLCLYCVRGECLQHGGRGGARVGREQFNPFDLMAKKDIADFIRLIDFSNLVVFTG
jgi:hypothetical protein